MTRIVRVKPAGHNMVRNPDAALRHVDPAGEMVEWNNYWARRLEAKEIVIVEDEAPAPKGTQEKK